MLGKIDESILIPNSKFWPIDESSLRLSRGFPSRVFVVVNELGSIDNDEYASSVGLERRNNGISCRSVMLVSGITSLWNRRQLGLFHLLLLLNADSACPENLTLLWLRTRGITRTFRFQ